MQKNVCYLCGRRTGLAIPFVCMSVFLYDRVAQEQKNVIKPKISKGSVNESQGTSNPCVNVYSKTLKSKVKTPRKWRISRLNIS